MTREFNKQRRDAMRPSSRRTSSGRHGDERPARPARPRLNRETVDRAWESGAQQQHADYRPRSSSGPSPRRHNNHRSEYSSSQNSRGGNRSYGNRQDRRPRSRSFDSERRTSDSPRFQDRERRRYSDEPNEPGARPRFQDRERRHYSDESNETAARPRFRNDVPSRGRSSQFYDRQQRNSQQRDGDYRDRSQRRPAHDARRSYSPEQQERFSHDRQQHDTQPMRRPDRPLARHDDTSRPRDREQFEGDYEHLGDDTPHRLRHSEGHPPRSKRERAQKPELHVTRLPDGRVLKGSRPAQRKNAQFWMEVAEDTEELLDHVHTTNEGDEMEQADAVKAVKTPAKKKSRTETASSVTRRKKADTPKKPRATGSKPPRHDS